MADYNIALGVKPPEPINYLGQMGQIYALRAAQDEIQGNEAVKQFYAQGGDLSTPEARARLKSLNPKFGMAAEKAQLESQKTQAEIQKLGFENINKAFAQSREFLNGIDYTAPDAGEKMKAWHIANHKDPFLGPLLASRGINPAQSMSDIEAAIAKGPIGVRDALRRYSMGQEKYQADLMALERGESVARIGAGPGWAQANLAREKYEKPAPTLQVIGNQVFEVRAKPTGTEVKAMPPPGAATNALAPQQPPASMVNNMLADKSPTALTSVPPPVMSPQAFDTTQPAPAAPAAPATWTIPAKPVWNAEAKAWMTPPTAEKPEGTFVRPAEATAPAKKNVNAMLDKLYSAYSGLQETGGIVDVTKPAAQNIGPGLAATGVGQAASKLMGTPEQRFRNEIETTRPLLLAAIKEATGMSAKQMDSNAELKFYLAAASDPTLDIQSNIQALNTLSKMYGLGKEFTVPESAAPRTRGSVGGESPAPRGGAAIYATNGKERIMSTDGGVTWKPAGGK